MSTAQELKREEDCEKMYKGDLRGEKWRIAYKTKLFSWNVLPSSLNKSTPATPKIFTWRNLKHSRGKVGRGGIFLQMATAGEAAACKRINISRINLSSSEGRLLGARVIRMNLI